jgi:hypothetical protein
MNNLRNERISPMKKIIFISLILILASVLAACTTLSGQGAAPGGAPSGIPGGGTVGAGGPGGGQGQSTTGNGTAQTQTMPVDSIVGIGIIKLEGTDSAIDSETATNLLPLFKALKALSTNSNTSVAEMTALNKQIKNTLTADQLTAIENLKITSADVNKLLKEKGLASSAFSGSSSSAGNRNNGGMGGPPDAAMMMTSGMGGGSTTTTSKTQATPNAVAALTTSRKTAGGYNLTFADIVIKTLQAKVTK